MGDTTSGPFDMPGELARKWLCLPANPNGRPNADVLKPWVNAMDLTRRPSDKWIVDFGWDMADTQAALYEAPFGHVKEHVWPMRQRNRRESYRLNWWRHVEPRQGMWRALGGLTRCIATPGAVALDATVAAAYGWSPHITEDEALRELLIMNQAT